MRSAVIFSSCWLLGFVAGSNHRQSKSSGPKCEKQWCVFDVMDTEDINSAAETQSTSESYPVLLNNQRVLLESNSLIKEGDFSFLEGIEFMLEADLSDIFPNHPSYDFKIPAATDYLTTSNVCSDSSIDRVKQGQSSLPNLIFSESDWNILLGESVMEQPIIPNQNGKKSQPTEKMETQQQEGEQKNILPIGNYFVPENVSTFEPDYQEKNMVEEQSGNSTITKIDSQSVNLEMQPDLPPIVRSSYTLSWYGADVKSKTFKSEMIFFLVSPVSLHCGTDDSKFMFCLLYSFEMVKLLRGRNNEFSMSWSHSVIYQMVDAVLQTFSQFRPTFFIFDPSGNDEYRTFNHLRVPPYFLYTSLSFLLQNENFVGRDAFFLLAKKVYFQIFKEGKYLSNNWKFVKKTFEKHFKITQKVELDDNYCYQYDISTVSFIYNEMIFGESEFERLFYSHVWNAYKSDCCRRKSIKICNDPLMNIPVIIKNKPNSFELSTRKLYQMKFIELLDKAWESMDDLLEEYRMMEFYFDSILLDFRLRIFNLFDFQLLDKSLKRISLLLLGQFFSDIEIVRKFFTELECFINFKCILFVRDFCLELEKVKSGRIYQSSFTLINSIHDEFENIRTALKRNGIFLGKINYKKVSSKKSFSLQEMIKNFPMEFFNFKSIVPLSNEPFDVKTMKMNSQFMRLSSYLKSFDYFDSDFNTLPYLTRFQFNEYLVEFKEHLNKNDETSINEIFKNEEHKEIRKFGFDKYKKYLISRGLPGQYVFSFEEKKLLIGQFLEFLILYNQ